VLLLAQLHIQTGASFLSLSYGHYIWQLLDRQYHQLSDFIGWQKQPVKTAKWSWWMRLRHFYKSRTFFFRNEISFRHKWRNNLLPHVAKIQIQIVSKPSLMMVRSTSLDNHVQMPPYIICDTKCHSSNFYDICVVVTK